MSKFYKRIFAVLVTFTLTISLLPSLKVNAADVVASGKCGPSVTWSLDREGTITFSGTGVLQADDWNDYSDSIKKATVEEGVTSIYMSTFYNCKNLESVTFPNSLTSIDSYAFDGCTSLESILLPRNCSMGENVFDNCNAALKLYYYYDATYTTDGNGEVTGKARTYFGDELTITPKTHFVVDQVTYKDANGKEGSIDPDADGRYFMPDSDSSMEVTVYFKHITADVRFVDEDGTEISSAEYNEGTAAEDIIKPVDPVKDAGDHCSVTFAGWTPEIAEVTGDATYTATYTVVEHTEVIDEGVSATCTENGLTEGKHCSVCNKVLVEQEEILAKGHVWVIDEAVSATCTENGLTEGKHCSVCNKVLVEQEETLATGHRWDEGVITKEPTFMRDGIRTHTCLNDTSHTMNEVIPARGRGTPDGPELQSQFEPAAAKISGTLMTKMTAKGNNALVLKWTKIKGVEGYDIFINPCSKHSFKKVKSLKGEGKLKYTVQNLAKRTAYKAYVKAWVTRDGKKTYVRTGPMVYAYTSGGTKRMTNAKSVKVKKTKVTLKVGKTYKIRAKVTKLRKGRLLMGKKYGAKIRYKSTDKKVAKVSRNGKIKAVGKGKCRIYVYASNGARKTVSVTVTKP